MIACSVTPAASLQNTGVEMFVGGTDKLTKAEIHLCDILKSVGVLLNSVHPGRQCNLENTCTERLGDSLLLR